MIRTIYALVTVAGLLGFAGQAMAQDPVTERPGKVETPKVTPQPKATPQPAAKSDAKLLAKLEGREEWGSTGELSFQIYQGGKAVMIDSTRKPVTGTASTDGKTLLLTFGNCVYECTENNGVFTGKARYTSGQDAGKSWNFRVGVHVPVVGRTFAGQETLAGYGAVSFRFIDANSVEMTDRDGTTRGTYRRDGLRMTMSFGATTYTGDIRGNAISGTAQDGRSSWTFQITGN